MPQIVLPVAGAIFGKAAVAWATGTLIGQVVTGTALSLAASSVLKPRTPGLGQIQQDIHFGTNLSYATNEPRRVVFGRAGVAGVHAWSKWNADETKFYRRVVLSTVPSVALVGVYSADEQLFFDGDVTTGWRNCTSAYLGEGGEPRLRMRVYLGDQTAVDPVLASIDGTENAATAIGKNLTYAAYEVTADPKAFPNSEPQFVFVLDGARCFDITQATGRGGSGDQVEGDPETWDGSQNLMVHYRQFLRGLEYNGRRLVGAGAPVDELPDEHWLAETAIAGEAVPLAAGGTEPRYAGGCIVSAAEAPRSVMEDMLASMGGVHADQGGTIVVRPYTPARAIQGVVRASDFYIDEAEEDELGPSWKTRLNQATGEFRDPEMGYKPQPLPFYDRADLRVSEDGGQLETAALPLRFLPSFTQGQRLLKQRVELSRVASQHTGAGKMRLWNFAEGEWVLYDMPGHHLDGAIMQVTRSALRTDPQGFGKVDWAAERVAQVTWSIAEERARSGSTVAPGAIPGLAISGVAVGAGTRQNGAAKIPFLYGTWTPVPRFSGVAGVRWRAIRLDGEDGDPVPGGEVLNASAAALDGRCEISGAAPDAWYRMQYRLVAPSGRITDWTDTDDVKADSSLEPTGVGGVPAASIAAVADDGVLSITEKRAVVPDVTALVNNRTALEARAAIYSVSTTAYAAALDALETYLGTLEGLTPPEYDWNDLAGPTTVAPQDWVDNVVAAKQAADALLDAIETASGSGNVVLNPDGTLDNGVGTGGGVTFSGLGGGSLGLLDSLDWVDLTGRPVWLTDGRVNLGLDADGDYIRNLVLSQVTDAGALAALDAIAWASDITGVPANLAALTGSEGILNALISINADGSLSGAGAGNVTLAGIGAGDVALLDLVTDAYIPSGAGIKQTKLDRPVAEATRGTGANFTSVSWADIASGSVANIPDYPGWLLNGTEFYWPASGAADSASTVAEWRVVEDNGVTQIVLASGELRFDDSGGPVVFDAASSTLPDAFWYGARPGTYTGSLDIRLQCQVTSGSWIAPTTATLLRARLQ